VLYAALRSCHRSYPVRFHNASGAAFLRGWRIEFRWFFARRLGLWRRLLRWLVTRQLGRRFRKLAGLRQCLVFEWEKQFGKGFERGPL
jgi:hypothetical protein